MASSQSNNAGPTNGLSSTYQSSWQRPSIPYDPSLLRQQIPPSIDPDNRRVSQIHYSPENPTDPGVQSPNSRSGSQPSGATQPVYTLQNPYTGQSIPDLSALMFPSADPFVYPNQPMTTLENRQYIKQENAIPSGMFDLPGPIHASAPYHTTNPQVYGQPPSFLMQGQQPGNVPNVYPSTNLGSRDNSAPLIPRQESSTEGWPQQQHQFDQIFGEDWGGWMNQGGR